MILPIYIYGQPVLRKVSQDIPKDYPQQQQLIDNMFETLDASEGIGLAAPQIGHARPRLPPLALSIGGVAGRRRGLV